MVTVPTPAGTGARRSIRNSSEVAKQRASARRLAGSAGRSGSALFQHACSAPYSLRTPYSPPTAQLWLPDQVQGGLGGSKSVGDGRLVRSQRSWRSAGRSSVSAARATRAGPAPTAASLPQFCTDASATCSATGGAQNVAPPQGEGAPARCICARSRGAEHEHRLCFSGRQHSGMGESRHTGPWTRERKNDTSGLAYSSHHSKSIYDQPADILCPAPNIKRS